MFGKNLGCHVIKFPSGRWGYVGNVPANLGDVVPASTSDVMGGRAHRNAAGELVTIKLRSFPTEPEARAFAAAQGATLAN
jgi:hypothetical protein